MAKVIAVVNQKGGVGKTTTCVNLGAALSQKSFKVLLVDLDPMGSLSGWLMDEPSENGTGTGDLIRGTVGFYEAIKRSETLGVDFIPAGKHLTDVVMMENIDPFILGERLGSWVDKYDFVLIDCAPSANVLIANAIIASDGIIIPIQTETLPLKSGLKFIQWLAEFKTEYDARINVLGILPCMFDSRTRLSLQILEAMKSSESLGPLVFNTVIRKNIRVAEAPGMRRSLFKSASKSSGASDYASLALEVAERCGLEIPAEPAASEPAPEQAKEATETADNPADDQVTAENMEMQS